MRGRLTGRLLLRGEPGYEQARTGRIFNARRPDRFPAAVLEARCDDDVIEGVRLAGERGWPVSVRSGGHSWAAWSLRDDALLIDLGELRDIGYDPATGVVAARPAVQGGRELAPFLAERGRAFPGGHCATVGLGGFLLQGGQGWDSRARGWACQSVAGLDVVTADGTLVHADERENPDLLWAARGAGPGFPGIITRFRLRTYPAPPAMWHDTWSFRLDDTVELLTWLHEVLPELDRRVEPVVAATRLPDVPLHEGTVRPDGTVLLLHTTVMAGSDEEALGLLAPLRRGPLAARALGHVPAAGPACSRRTRRRRRRTPRATGTWWTAPGPTRRPGCWPRCCASCGASSTPSTRSPSGTAGLPGGTCPDMAFSVEANVYLATYAIYTDPADDARYEDWVHRRMAALAAAHGAGVYIGDTNFTRRQDRFVSDEAYRRLAAVRAERDPEGRFASYLTADPERLNVHG